jgi:hypothetical protein
VTTGEQKAYIRDYITRFENMMKSPAFADPVNGYRKWIDVKTFVDYLLVEELAKNKDGYRLSGYLWKQSDRRGGLLSAGPVWDFDIAWGNSYDAMNAGEMYFDWSKPDDYVLNLRKGRAKPLNIPDFWYQLMEDNAFTRDLKCRWQELRKTVFSNAALNGKMDAWTTLLDGALKRDQAKWKTLGRWVWPNIKVFNTTAEELKFMRDFVNGRTQWLDANLPGTCTP